MRRGTRGFTLIEVLIALAIVSIALAAVMRSVAVATDDQSRLRDRRLALLCAQDRWQELRLGGQAAPDARQRCVQGRSRFLVLQHIGTAKAVSRLPLETGWVVRVFRISCCKPIIDT